MSEHELWNELGNLYFMSGAYKQASHAYNRSIQLENRYGRPYSNLAFSCVQQGKFTEAVELYRSSLELLTDDKEKAITWFRLGDVYRRLKDYRDAILAYQQADQLDPSLSQDEGDVSKVLYGASNLTPSADQATIEPVRTEPIVVEDILPETSNPDAPPAAEILQPLIADEVAAEPIIQDDPVPDALETEAIQSELVTEDLPSETQIVESESVSAGDEPIADLDEIEGTLPDFIMESDDQLPEIEEENRMDTGEARPDAWMMFTDEEQPDETRTEWISNMETGEEPAVTFPAAKESYPATNYSMPAPSLPSEQVSYSERKDLMVVDKQPITTFIVAPKEEEPPATVEMVVEAVEEAPQAPPVTLEDEPSSIEDHIQALRRTVHDEPTNASAWDELGELYKTIHIYNEAIPAYQQAVENDPKNLEYLYHLGCAYAIEGFADDAVKTFQQIIKLDSSHALAHATLGGYYRKMGLEELAQKHIGKAVKNFYDSENEYNRACLQALCGNVEDAIELLRTALQTEQTYVDWVLRDPDLDTIRNDSRFKQLISDFS